MSGKWALQVVTALAAGPQRNGALLRRIDGISQKVLTQTLRELERSGLVERTDYGTVPPSVDYRLSALGRSLDQALAPLDQWAEARADTLTAARGHGQSE